jgi:hypothetical protein
MISANRLSCELNSIALENEGWKPASWKWLVGVHARKWLVRAQESGRESPLSHVAGLRLVRGRALVSLQRFDDAKIVLNRLTGLNLLVNLFLRYCTHGIFQLITLSDDICLLPPVCSSQRSIRKVVILNATTNICVWHLNQFGCTGSELIVGNIWCRYQRRS